MTLLSLISSIKENGFVILNGKEAKSIHELIARERVGKLLPQDKHGTKIYDVKPQTDVEDTASSKGTLNIAPHTDGALTDNPPKFVALYGQNVPNKENCRTHICNISDVFNSLTPEERTILKFPDPNDGIFKYSFQMAVYDFFWITETQLQKSQQELTSEKKAAVQSMTNAIEHYETSFSLRQGDLLIIDNHNTLHYRGSIASPERHLLRYWIADHEHK